MKKLLFGTALIFMLGSCSSDGDNVTSTENNLLIATWTYSHKYQNEYYYPPSLCADKNQLAFRADNTLKGEYYTRDNSGNCYIDEVELATWEKSNAQLKVRYEDVGTEPNIKTYEILKLTENELELKLIFDSSNYHIYAYKR